MDLPFLSYALIRLLTYPISWMPYSAVQRLGKTLGTLAFYLMPNFRKRALSNLALAQDLHLTNEDIVRYAKESFQNLMTTCLEYPKLAKEKNIASIAHCENPETALKLMQEGKPVIFFCGHQSNWEILFLEGTSRMPGVAIGRPVKNPYLYKWVVSIREKCGGKIINRQNAVWDGLRALKKGSFLGIVGDQGMPDSGYSSTFFGRKAWSSPLPAILSYRTGSPILVATTRRENGKYITHYSDPIWPDTNVPMEKEMDRMMRQALSYLEATIRSSPGEWLWQHNRWKQQTADLIKRPYRQESLCIILPEEKPLFDSIVPHLPTFREIYPYEFITVMVPKAYQDVPIPIEAEKTFYATEQDLLVKDYRFKLIYNFSSYSKVRSHFLRLSAFKVVSLEDLNAKCAKADLSFLLKKEVCHAR